MMAALGFNIVTHFDDDSDFVGLLHHAAREEWGLTEEDE